MADALWMLRTLSGWYRRGGFPGQKWEGWTFRLIVAPCSKWKLANRLQTMKQASLSSIFHGGGKRRADGMER